MADMTYAEQNAEWLGQHTEWLKRKKEEWLKKGKQDGAAQSRHIGHGDPARGQSSTAPAEDDDILVTDEDLLSGEEAGDIGDLGNEFDDIDALIAYELDVLQSSPTRKSWMAHRALEALRGLKHLRSRPAEPWPKDRVPEKLWRMLGDQALGLKRIAEKQLTLEDVVAEADEEERLIKQCPEEDQKIIRGLFVAFRLLAVFRDNFEWQRQMWEQAYWRRANAEAFGHRPWTGPSGREDTLC